MGMNEHPVLTLSMEADEDMSSSQYYGVAISDEMSVDLVDADTDIPCGIVLNEPESGEMALVGVIGIFPIVAGEAIPVGSQVRIGSAGTAMVFDIDTDTTSYCIGQCIRAAGDAAEKALVIVNCCNPYKGEE